MDAGDLFIVLADTLRAQNGILGGGILIDQDTLEIQGNIILNLY